VIRLAIYFNSHMRIVKQIFDIIPMQFPEFIQNRGAGFCI
jgi:hypothetical protein